MLKVAQIIMNKTFSVRTTKRSEFVDITREVQIAVADLGIKDGVVTVYVPHTTAGVTINEHADPDVVRDMIYYLDKTVPRDDPADRNADGNTAAHIKASFMGTAARALVQGGRLKLGTWQGIFFCEFDGPRERQVWVAGA